MKRTHKIVHFKRDQMNFTHLLLSSNNLLKCEFLILYITYLYFGNLHTTLPLKLNGIYK